MTLTSPLSIVLAGGGCRAFWTLGVVEQLRRDLPPVFEWAGVSAGAAMAMLYLADYASDGVVEFERLTAANPRNVYPERLLAGRQPFPHEDIYRTALQYALQGDAFQRLSESPPLRILHAFIEAGHPRYGTAARALWEYWQHRRRGDLHGSETPTRGLGWSVFTAQQARSAGELVDAILTSSASPPVLSSVERDGRLFLDGGLVDNVPLRALSPAARAGRVIVLLTREQHANVGPVLKTSDRLYLGPSTPTPVAKFDYTSPQRIRATFELGLRDGERWRKVVQEFVG